MTTETEFKNDPLTRAELEATMEPVWLGNERYSIAVIGEDPDAFIVLGLLTEDEIKAAVRKHADWFGGDLDDARVVQGWTIFTPHRPGCEGLYEAAEPALGACDCEDDDSPMWWYHEILGHVAEANAKRPGAIAVTELAY